MSDTTSRKQWWAIFRREGYRDIQIRLPLNWVLDGSEYDRLVDQVLNSDDWEFVDDRGVLPSVSPDLQVQFEFVATTQTFESPEIDIE